MYRLLIRVLAAAGLAVAVPAASQVAPAGLSAEVLFQGTGIDRVEVSPSGEWISAIATHGRANGVLVQRSGRQEIEPVVSTESPVGGVWWAGASTLISLFHTPTGPSYLISRFSEENGMILIARSRVNAIGWLVDPLPRSDDEVLWAFDYKGHSSVHRVTLDELRGFRERRGAEGRFVLPGKRLASIRGQGRDWIIDREGNARAVTLLEDEGYTVFARAEPESPLRAQVTVRDGEISRSIHPVGITGDGSKLIVLAYNGHDTMGLHEFDLKSRAYGEEIYRRPDVDVVDAAFDSFTGELVAAIFEADGERQYHYFDSFRDDLIGALQNDFPSEFIRVVSSSQDRRSFLFKVSSATNPGAYYWRDSRSETSLEIGRSRSSVDRNALSPVESFVVDSADGTQIEAFLTIPRSVRGEAAPLIVMPHGGPFDVRDNRSFDPLIQYFASWGFAVLQPNFRGSAGYGRNFVEAGKKQWAERIEDDIDAAVEHAMARPAIDGRRVCISGGSYGGFSALASVVRHRDRYRCAVSWNGVSDIPLLYDSSDMADLKRAMDFYEEFVGDLETERDKLITVSPAYHVNEIDTPVLILFGDQDRRVDPDHAHRMILMLETLGKEHDVLEIEGMTHGYSPAEAVIIARAMRRYWTRYLYPGEPFRPDPDLGSMQDSYTTPTLVLEK